MKPKRRLSSFRLASIALMLGVHLVYLNGCTRCQVTRKPFDFSGVLRRGFRGHFGAEQKTIEFSPDGRMVAYLWSDGHYGPAPPGDERPRPRTLSESVLVRWFDVRNRQSERSVLLYAVSFPPPGERDFNIPAGPAFAPDSRHILAVCGPRLVVIDLIPEKRTEIEYPGEHFEGATWSGEDSLVFSTVRPQEGSRWRSRVAFWRLDVDENPDRRRLIYQEDDRMRAPPEAWALGSSADWSPLGGFRIFTSFARDQRNGQDVLLNLREGSIRNFGVSLTYRSWKPDESVLFVADPDHASPAGSQTPRYYLIDVRRGIQRDLSALLRPTVGTNPVTLVSPVWTPDGKYVCFYKSVWSTKTETGYVIEPDPFRIVFSKNAIIRQSPIAGWLLLQGASSYCWLNDAGVEGAQLAGWPGDWTWARDGRRAVTVEDEKLMLLDVPPPSL